MIASSLVKLNRVVPEFGLGVTVLAARCPLASATLSKHAAHPWQVAVAFGSYIYICLPCQTRKKSHEWVYFPPWYCCTGLVLVWHAVDHAAHFSDFACKPGLPVCQFSL